MVELPGTLPPWIASLSLWTMHVSCLQESGMQSGWKSSWP